MLYKEYIKFSNLIIHQVGNKFNQGNYNLSKKTIELDTDLKQLLITYFISPFKADEYFLLNHEIDLSMNEVFVCVSKIFDDQDEFYEQSVNLVKHLYEQSTHPKIKGGEFYVVYFKDCIVDGDTVDAVGLFKSENKDTFLKVYPSGDGFEIESQQGVNINKLDKGCLIFNKEKENGFVVAVVDNTNKGAEAKYWIEDFLHVKPRNDEYANTKNVLSLTKNFVMQELPQRFDVSKADQADILNKSVEFFKKKESFDMSDFAKEVIGQEKLIESFNQYKTEYEQAIEMAIQDQFAISESAVKKQARSFKRIIKLDKNFDILIHGTRDLIEQGVEADGRKYYKIYYREEK
ncbi:nucleoid-associated protein [Paludibacter sp.]|uniref:nucleoid-associated protein n=1 Tax=Paludibacter sp. TaxID=1898105 RepID=UPI0013546A75|nr:nucleoid-associated protein [Paludibacter sp.]MTK53451.1 nucleoid-associated protein [Paludibacter sp.]